MPRRRGRPGLVGTMARTAVIAGTASAVVGASTDKRAAQANAVAAQQCHHRPPRDAQMADMQAQLDQMNARKGPRKPNRRRSTKPWPTPSPSSRHRRHRLHLRRPGAWMTQWLSFSSSPT